MIESADEFKRWFDALPSDERHAKLREPAAPETWWEIVQQFPECRAAVARSRDVPLDVLEVLRQDVDEGVRWQVRSTARWLEHHPEDARPWNDHPDQLIQFRLTDQERAVLRAGLAEWGGPAHCTEELARAMGFQGIRDLFDERKRIAVAIVEGQPLSRTDWTRALLATEIVFMSNVIGAGLDWKHTAGFSDVRTLEVIRGLQRKIVTAGVIGRAFGTRPRKP